MNWIVVAIIVLVVFAGGLLTVYFLQEDKMQKVKEQTIKEYQELCENEKLNSQDAANTLLRTKIAEKDKIIEEEKAKYDALVAQGTMTSKQADEELQKQIDTVNAELATVKEELEKQVLLTKEKEEALALIQIQLENKRVCSRITNVRKAGAGFKVGGVEDQAQNFGAVKTLDECEKACKDDTNCKQFVWTRTKRECFPMLKSYDEGEYSTNHISGTCSS